MESLGNILNNSNLLNSAKTGESEKRLPDGNLREAALLSLISRMYTSCRKELPEADILDYEVQIALEDLEEIPDAMLRDCFAEAVAASDGFLPGNGKILSVFRGKKGDQFKETQRAIRMENNAKYLAPPSQPLPTPEFLADFFSRNHLQK